MMGRTSLILAAIIFMARFFDDAAYALLFRRIGTRTLLAYSGDAQLRPVRRSALLHVRSPAQAPYT